MNINNILAETTFNPDLIIGNIGAPLIIGFALGYFFKKTIKFMIFILGALIAGIFVAEYFNVVQLDINMMKDAVEIIRDHLKGNYEFFFDKISKISSVGIGLSGSAGFFVALKYT
jgi:uncharacterized membrane protein (Fun14 family)